MNGADAIRMLGWTRERLETFLEYVPEDFLDYKPQVEIPKTENYKKPRSILSHITGVESYWIHEKIILNPFESSVWSFPKKTKQEIIEAMNKIRNRTLEWLNENIEKDLEATYTPRAKKTYACLFYHVAEHEAHHLGQLAMLTTFAGIKTPWV